MADLTGANRALNTDELSLIRQEIDSEKAAIVQLKLLHDELCQLQVQENGEHDVEKLNTALQTLSVSEYLQLNNKEGDTLLDLPGIETIELSPHSYTLVQDLLYERVRNKLKPILDCGEELQKRLPLLFADNEHSSSKPLSDDPELNEILVLESKYRANLQKILMIRNEKCTLLKKAAELKAGPYAEIELDAIQAAFELNQVKANVLGGYMTRELFVRAENSRDAYKQIEQNLLNSIENDVEDSAHS